MQISSDLSIMDMDVAFAFGFSMAASTNALSNLGVNAFVTWQIMFVVIPLLFVMRRLQVDHNPISGYTIALTQIYEFVLF